MAKDNYSSQRGSTSSLEPPILRVQVLYGYEAEEENELTLVPGDVITVLEGKFSQLPISSPRLLT